MARPYDDADDLQEREQYTKDQGVDHEQDRAPRPGTSKHNKDYPRLDQVSEPINSLEEITETSVLQRAMNKSLMVAYINKHSAYTLDTRKSFVYYDADKDFVTATSIELGGPGAEKAFEVLGIKYWSKGIV